MAPISRTVQKPSAPAATPTLVVKKTNMESEDGGKPWPRKQDATEYLAKHKILQLFDNLTSQLIYNEPS